MCLYVKNLIYLKINQILFLNILYITTSLYVKLHFIVKTILYNVILVNNNIIDKIIILKIYFHLS